MSFTNTFREFERRGGDFTSYPEFVDGLKFGRIFTFWLDEYVPFRDVGVWMFFWNCWWRG